VGFDPQKEEMPLILSVHCVHVMRPINRRSHKAPIFYTVSYVVRVTGDAPDDNVHNCILILTY